MEPGPRPIVFACWIAAPLLLLGAACLALSLGLLRGAPVIVKWYTCEQLPRNPFGGTISLTNEGSSQGLVFLVIETKIPGNLLEPHHFTTQELEEWRRRHSAGEIASSDAQSDLLWSYEIKLAQFELDAPDGVKYSARGSSTIDPNVGGGFTSSESILTSQNDKPKSLTIAVFFVVERKVVERGRLTFQYKDLRPLGLTATLESARR
jgi:hypothetical protein